MMLRAFIGVPPFGVLARFSRTCTVRRCVGSHEAEQILERAERFFGARDDVLDAPDEMAPVQVAIGPQVKTNTP